MTESNGAVEIGRRIALLRRRLGLLQVAFPRQAGNSWNALIGYERGGRMPKSAALGRVAEAGGTSVDWLLNGHAPRASRPPRSGAEWDEAIEALRAAWRDPVRRHFA